MLQRPHHEGDILQSDQALARTRNLVTAPAWGALPAHSPDARPARPVRAQHAPHPESSRGCRVGPARRPGWRSCWPNGNQVSSNTVDARGCDDPDQKGACNTSTYAAPPAPWPLLQRGTDRSPSGHAHALRRQFEEDRFGAEEDASETIFGRRRTSKKMHVHTGRFTADSGRRPHRLDAYLESLRKYLCQ